MVQRLQKFLSLKIFFLFLCLSNSLIIATDLRYQDYSPIQNLYTMENNDDFSLGSHSFNGNFQEINEEEDAFSPLSISNTHNDKSKSIFSSIKKMIKKVSKYGLTLLILNEPTTASASDLRNNSTQDTETTSNNRTNKSFCDTNPLQCIPDPNIHIQELMNQFCKVQPLECVPIYTLNSSDICASNPKQCLPNNNVTLTELENNYCSSKPNHCFPNTITMRKPETAENSVILNEDLKMMQSNFASNSTNLQNNNSSTGNWSLGIPQININNIIYNNNSYVALQRDANLKCDSNIYMDMNNLLLYNSDTMDPSCKKEISLNYNITNGLDYNSMLQNINIVPKIGDTGVEYDVNILQKNGKPYYVVAGSEIMQNRLAINNDGTYQLTSNDVTDLNPSISFYPSMIPGANQIGIQYYDGDKTLMDDSPILQFQKNAYFNEQNSLLTMVNQGGIKGNIFIFPDSTTNLPSSESQISNNNVLINDGFNTLINFQSSGVENYFYCDFNKASVDFMGTKMRMASGIEDVQGILLVKASSIQLFNLALTMSWFLFVVVFTTVHKLVLCYKQERCLKKSSCFKKLAGYKKSKKEKYEDGIAQTNPQTHEEVKEEEEDNKKIIELINEKAEITQLNHLLEHKITGNHHIKTTLIVLNIHGYITAINGIVGNSEKYRQDNMVMYDDKYLSFQIIANSIAVVLTFCSVLAKCYLPPIFMKHSKAYYITISLIPFLYSMSLFSTLYSYEEKRQS